MVNNNTGMPVGTIIGMPVGTIIWRIWLMMSNGLQVGMIMEMPVGMILEKIRIKRFEPDKEVRGSSSNRRGQPTAMIS